MGTVQPTTRDEKEVAEFCEIIRDGGYLIAHPDTIARFVAKAGENPDFATRIFAVEFYPNEYMKPGELRAFRRLDPRVAAVAVCSVIALAAPLVAGVVGTCADAMATFAAWGML